MNNADLADKLAEATGTTKADALKTVNALTPILTGELQGGNQISLSGFGILKPKTTAARTGRHPGTGEPLDIPARNGVSFAASSVLKKALNPA